MKTTIQALVICAASLPLLAQAAEFRNLDFEQAYLENMVFSQPDGGYHGTVGDLLPGWGLNYNGVSVEKVWARGGATYPNALLNPIGATYHGAPLPPSYPAQGHFSISLFPVVSETESKGSFVLSQRGVIPADAKSIQFLTYFQGFKVFIDNVEISIGNKKMTDDVFGPRLGSIAFGDISQYAGREVDLKFETYISDDIPCCTGPNISSHSIDSISFSPQTVPEPSTLGLLAVGAGALLLRRRKRQGS